MQVCYSMYYIIFPFSASNVSNNVVESAMLSGLIFTFFLLLAVAYKDIVIVTR
jgi:hypothetical protein